MVFAFMCIGASFGGGNMFQSEPVLLAQISSDGVLPGTWPPTEGNACSSDVVPRDRWWVVVIIGGIRRIGEVAAALVPVHVRDLS